MKLILDNGKEIVLSEETSDILENAIREKSKIHGFHDLSDKGKYCFVTDDGLVDHFDNDCNEFDIRIHNNINAFTTEDFAEKIAFKQLVERKLLKFSLEHDGDKIDLNNAFSEKFIIHYDVSNDCIGVEGFFGVTKQGAIVFGSFSAAYEAIKEFNDDLIKYFQLDFGK